jgi:conjugative relaxase-like TrwC/TraI family protein
MTNVSPAQSCSYYYARDDVGMTIDRNQVPQWFGQGAQRLKLEGNVIEQDLRTVLHGRGPNGEKLRRRRRGYEHKSNGQIKQERAAVDLTFDSGKSVSIAALVQDDLRIIQVHHQAVIKALEVVERSCAVGHIRTKGNDIRELTGNIVAATFTHTTSRELDPQLHIHAVVVSTTRCSDGTWRALRSEKLFQDHRSEIKATYDNAMQLGLEQLGYDTFKHEKGTIGIKGYLPFQLKAFSTRRQEIIEATGQDADWGKRQVAALKTRKAKQHDIDAEKLMQEWKQRAIAIGVDLLPPIRAEQPEEALIHRKHGISL